MGFVEPTPVQKETIPAALKGQDVLGTAQTGTGKTAAFGIPLLNFIHLSSTQRALVLAPTRELALQIHQVLNEMGRDLKMKGTVLIGGEPFGRQAEQLRRGTDYIWPLREGSSTT
jgi:ATP-dependent RNA helicase DeaD